MEIGKTCIHTDYRNLLVVDTFWQGLASLIVMHNIDYVFGSVSIPGADAGRYAQAVMKFVRTHHFANEELRVYPKISVPSTRLPSKINVVLPSVLKTYFRFGALVCGEAYWDPANQVADLLFLLDRSSISARFTKPITEHVSSLTAG
jgi:putative hemolysin